MARRAPSAPPGSGAAAFAGRRGPCPCTASLRVRRPPRPRRSARSRLIDELTTCAPVMASVQSASAATSASGFVNVARSADFQSKSSSVRRVAAPPGAVGQASVTSICCRSSLQSNDAQAANTRWAAANVRLSSQQRHKCHDFCTHKSRFGGFLVQLHARVASALDTSKRASRLFCIV